MLQDRGVESPDPLPPLFLLKDYSRASSREIDCSPKCFIRPLQMDRPGLGWSGLRRLGSSFVKALTDGRAIIVDYPLRPDAHYRYQMANG